MHCWRPHPRVSLCHIRVMAANLLSNLYRAAASLQKQTNAAGKQELRSSFSVSQWNPFGVSFPFPCPQSFILHIKHKLVCCISLATRRKEVNISYSVILCHPISSDDPRRINSGNLIRCPGKNHQPSPFSMGLPFWFYRQVNPQRKTLSVMSRLFPWTQ